MNDKGKIAEQFAEHDRGSRSIVFLLFAAVLSSAMKRNFASILMRCGERAYRVHPQSSELMFTGGYRSHLIRYIWNKFSFIRLGTTRYGSANCSLGCEMPDSDFLNVSQSDDTHMKNPACIGSAYVCAIILSLREHPFMLNASNNKNNEN